MNFSTLSFCNVFKVFFKLSFTPSLSLSRLCVYVCEIKSSLNFHLIIFTMLRSLITILSIETLRLMCPKHFWSMYLSSYPNSLINRSEREASWVLSYATPGLLVCLIVLIYLFNSPEVKKNTVIFCSLYKDMVGLGNK